MTAATAPSTHHLELATAFAALKTAQVPGKRLDEVKVLIDLAVECLSVVLSHPELAWMGFWVNLQIRHGFVMLAESQLQNKPIQQDIWRLLVFTLSMALTVIWIQQIATKVVHAAYWFKVLDGVTNILSVAMALVRGIACFTAASTNYREMQRRCLFDREYGYTHNPVFIQTAPPGSQHSHAPPGRSTPMWSATLNPSLFPFQRFPLMGAGSAANWVLNPQYPIHPDKPIQWQWHPTPDANLFTDAYILHDNCWYYLQITDARPLAPLHNAPHAKTRPWQITGVFHPLTLPELEPGPPPFFAMPPGEKRTACEKEMTDYIVATTQQGPGSTNWIEPLCWGVFLMGVAALITALVVTSWLPLGLPTGLLIALNLLNAIAPLLDIGLQAYQSYTQNQLQATQSGTAQTWQTMLHDHWAPITLLAIRAIASIALAVVYITCPQIPLVAFALICTGFLLHAAYRGYQACQAYQHADPKLHPKPK